MYTYILNPFNLKKINIHSTMGKSILKTKCLMCTKQLCVLMKNEVRIEACGRLFRPLKLVQ